MNSGGRSPVESVLALAEKWYAWRESRVMLKWYQRVRRENAGLAGRDLYERILTRRSPRSPISAAQILDRTEESAATAAEYPRIAGYFARANARTEVPGLRGMLGYLNYALDHPQIFRYMFSCHRADAFVFPHDLKESKSPTFNILLGVVSELMEREVLRSDDVAETALSIWAHAHGLITLYLCGRIAAPRATFQKLYMRSLDRLLHGLAAHTADNG